MYFIAAFMNIKRGKEGERQLLIIIPLQPFQLPELKKKKLIITVQSKLKEEVG